MNLQFKPALRLSIVFILAVVVSGSILTYFSINNISNLKELTEKRIIEEQRELCARFSAALENKIDLVSSGFINEIIPSALMKDSLIKTGANYDFIIQPFILESNNHFIYPNFIGIPDSPGSSCSSNQYQRDFKKGEEAEFAKRDLSSAKYYYSSCLSYSTGSGDSAKVLNALGRISVKLNDFKNAAAYYNTVTSDYFTLIDDFGLPYVYYAIPQLFKTTDTGNPDKLLPVIESCLQKMGDGSIPLNYHTAELLTRVMKWIQEKTFDNQDILSHVKELAGNIYLQLQFIDIYKREFAELLEKTNLTNHYTVGNGFKVVNSFSGSTEDFLLINTHLINPAGFLINRKKLFESILQPELETGFKFNYRIEFPAGFNLTVSPNHLVHSSQLNPCFPAQMIRIKLDDEKVIKDFITRRSWIYGIATALLLVAMFLGITLILRDIAREKHLARLRADFISNVTHELKTPLTSIHMFAESLSLHRVKSKTARNEYLSIIIRESERLKRMINNILEFSKIEKGKSEYQFVKSNLATIVHAVIQDMDYWLREEKFDVVVKLDENMEADVDPGKMKQAIGNLINNAIKYSAMNKKIFIRLFRENNQIRIEVEDRGIGIAEDQLSRIFEKFYRIDHREDISGTGLGLTVVKEIIEAHHGKIEVSSEIGKGSKFCLIFNQQKGAG